MQSISSFYLENEAAFVCSTGCNFIDPNGNTGSGSGGGNISVGQHEYYNPGDHNVPDQSVVNLAIQVHAGNDRTCAPDFIYDKSSPLSARYKISGTTYDSSIVNLGVS